LGHICDDSNAWIAKLEAAIQQLEAFVNRVNAMISSGILSAVVTFEGFFVAFSLPSATWMSQFATNTLRFLTSLGRLFCNCRF
jgi:hypothetical protein